MLLRCCILLVFVIAFLLHSQNLNCCGRHKLLCLLLGLDWIALKQLHWVANGWRSYPQPIKWTEELELLKTRELWAGRHWAIDRGNQETVTGFSFRGLKLGGKLFFCYSQPSNDTTNCFFEQALFWHTGWIFHISAWDKFVTLLGKIKPNGIANLSWKFYGSSW